MTSPRLTELPFLAASLAMALALALPWALPSPAEDAQQQAVEIGAILPWAVPEPAAGPNPVQFAGPAGATPNGVAQP